MAAERAGDVRSVRVSADESRAGAVGIGCAATAVAESATWIESAGGAAGVTVSGVVVSVWGRDCP